MNRFKKIRTALLADSLYRNSLLLMASTTIVSVLGFFFWTLCAHYYTPDQIGLAASLISVTALLTNLGFFGFNNTLIRYLPQTKDKSGHVSTAIWITMLAGIGVSAVFLGGIRTFAPALAGQLDGWASLVVAGYVVCAIIGAMLDSLFVAARTAQVILLKNTLMSLIKLALPLMFVPWGFFGIFTGIAIAMFAGTAYSAVLAYKRGVRLQAKIDKAVVREVHRFALGNYVASIFGSMPTTILPLMIVAVLGAQEAAYFYMPMMIATLLNVIPSASSQSLFAEASHSVDMLHHNIIKALRSILMLLLPAVLGVIVLGNIALMLFGQDYSDQGIVVLRLLAIASIFGAINYVGDTVLNVRKQIRDYIAMNALNAVLVIGACYVMMREWGLIGVGMGWLIGQALTVLVYLSLYGRKELRFARAALLTKT